MSTDHASGNARGLLRASTLLLDWNNHRAGDYARARWGRIWGQIHVLFMEAAVERLVKLECHVIDGGDEQLMAFKKSLESELTMIAVAGAIFAQIAVSAFSLPDMSQVHWIVRAFLACALVAGLLSVHFAAMQQRTLGNLYNASQVRSWLLATRYANLMNDPPALREEKFKVSFAAAFLIQVAYTMLEYGVALLVIGLALYFGYAWKKSLDTEPDGLDDRNVFIVFVTTTGVWLLQWAWAYFGKSIWLEPKTSLGDAEKLEQKALPGMTERPRLRLTHREPLRTEEMNEDLSSNGSIAIALDEAAECHRKSASASLKIAQMFESQAAETKQHERGSNGANDLPVRLASLYTGTEVTSSGRA